MRPGGKLILNGDNDMLSDEALIQAILEEYGTAAIETVYFGTEENSAYRAESIHGSSYELFTPSGQHFAVRLRVPGRSQRIQQHGGGLRCEGSGHFSEEAVDTLSLFGDEASRRKS